MNGYEEQKQEKGGREFENKIAEIGTHADK